MITRRERTILVGTALLAAGVPIGAASWVRSRTDDLAAQLTAVGGVPARIGSVDADLTGAIRLTDVALGSLVSVDALEASVAMSSLLGGQLRADEIRVDGPRVSLEVDANGDSDLARLARRLGNRGGAAAKRSQAGIRRIIVAEGALTARVAGLGELSANDVELVPDEHGVRVITGAVQVRGHHPFAKVELAFTRSAADLQVATMKFGRVLAVGGAGKVELDAATVALRNVSVGRLSAHGQLSLRGSVDDAGVPREVAVDVAPADFTVTLAGEHVPLAAAQAIVPHAIDLSRTHASGTLTIRKRSRLEIGVDGKLDDLVVDHRAIAGGPIPFTGRVSGDIAITPDAVAIPRATLVLGDLRVSTTGWVRRHGPMSGQVDAQLATASCPAMLASLPPALRGPLDGMVLDGELGARARLSIDLAAPEGEGATLATSITGNCTVVAEPPEADVTKLAETSEQQLADGTRAKIGKTEATFAALKALPYHVPAAFVSAEDGRFWEHDGFDVEQIGRSLEIDLRERRLARGGSTISQQLVKNAFLSQRRSVDRKIQEAVLTWRLEERLDKKQILERYLNIVELGPRIFGLRAAAKYWFNLSPRELSVRQAAFLAALTSQPTSMSRRIRKAGGLDPDSAERVAVVLRAMRRDGVISNDAYDAATHEGLYFTAAAVPRER